MIIDSQPHPASQFQYTLQLFNSSGQVVTEGGYSSFDGRAVASANSYVSANLAPGTYTLKITPISNPSTIAITWYKNYPILSFSFMQDFYQDVPYIRWYITSGGPYQIRWARTSGSLDVSLVAKDANGNIIGSGTSSNGNLTLHVNTGTGTFQLFVTPVSGTGSYSVGLINTP